MLTFASVLVFALASVANSVYGQSCIRSYTVQEGDICDSISAANNVSTYQLAAVNAGQIDSTCNNLVPGQILCLGYSGQDCTTTYVVRRHDDCDKVSKHAGINNTILYANNPQINTDCTNMYIGEVLCTADEVFVSGVPSSIPPAASATPTSSDGDDLPWCDEL